MIEAAFQELTGEKWAQNRVKEAYLVSAVGTSEHQIPAAGRGLSFLMEGRGPHGWHGAVEMAWQTPVGLGPLPLDLRSCQRKCPQACWLPGLEFGQWLGTYIVRKLGLCPQTGI